MSEDKKIIPGGELNDEELDAVSGGVQRQSTHGTPKQCARCTKEFPESALLGGYCKACRDELAKQGCFPPL